MKSGMMYNPQELLEQVKGKIGPKSKEEVNSWFEYPELMDEAKKLKRNENR
jgi:hypothetical protein